MNKRFLLVTDPVFKSIFDERDEYQRRNHDAVGFFGKGYLKIDLVAQAEFHQVDIIIHEFDFLIKPDFSLVRFIKQVPHEL